MLEARNRVLRVDFGLPNYEFVITRGKDRKDKRSTPEYLTKLIGTLSSTIQAVLPVRLQFDFLQQQQQTVSLKQTQSYLTLVKLTPMTKNGLL